MGYVREWVGQMRAPRLRGQRGTRGNVLKTVVFVLDRGGDGGDMCLVQVIQVWGVAPCVYHEEGARLWALESVRIGGSPGTSLRGNGAVNVLVNVVIKLTMLFINFR